MTLTEMIVEMRLELQEAVESVFLDTELTRAVQKTVGLMSRLIPKRNIVETTISIAINDESLVMDSDTGTSTYKPIDVGTDKIETSAGVAMVRNTDYTINYLTGVIDKIADGDMSDGTYVFDYKLAPKMFDLSTLLTTDYIKIERVEYPAGDLPRTNVTFDLVGSLIIFGGETKLAEDEHLRITYLEPWTAPTISTAATLTTALTGTNNDLLFTARSGGVAGNAITVTYTDPGTTGSISVAVTGTDIVVTLAYAAGAITSTGATVKAALDADSDAVALIITANASSNDGTGLVTAMAETALTSGSDTGVDGDYPEHLDTAVIIGGCGQALLFKAEKYVQSAVTALASLTAPTIHVYTEIGAPTLPTAPTAPTAPSPSYSDVGAALDKIATLADTEVGMITDAISYLTTGAALITTINDAENVPEKYAEYARAKLEVVSAYISRAITDLRNQEDVIALHAHEVSKYASEVNSYANEMSGTVGKYREQIEGQNAAVAFNTAMINKFVAQAGEQEMKARNFLDIAGRYLASGQSKINEFLVSIGVKPEFLATKVSSEQFS